MPNPWRDPQKARAWTPHGKPGNAQRAEQIRVVLDVLGAIAPRRVLDLGCGMGDIDAALLERLPDAALVCLDESPVMLERTGEAVTADADRVTLVQSPLEAPWSEETGGGFDAVVASQSIHHVEADAKRVLFERVHGVLRPGGLFLLNDKLAFDAAFWAPIVRLWDAARIPAGFEPFTRCASHAEYLAEERAGGDVPDTLEDQLAWLRAAGFDPVECFWRYADKAVFGGVRPRSTV